MTRSKFVSLISILTLLAILLGACGAETPSVQTVEVVKEVTKIVEGTPIVETVKEQVVVTATPEPTANPYDENAPIKVMADTTRAPAVDLFIQAHPEYKDLVQYMTDDRTQFRNKLLLYNNVGDGWMDVIFHETEELRIAATKQYDNFMADLTPWVPKELIDQFYAGAMAPCTLPDGKIICLRNDIAPFLLYYNTKTMKEWGYTVPTTWEEYFALAQKVAVEHPGTIMGTMNGWVTERHYQFGSECPYMVPLSPTKYRVNWLHPNCMRMHKLLDDLQVLGVLDMNPPFSAGIADKMKANEWLTYIGAAWEADFIFNGVYLDSTDPAFAGIVAMAPMVKWADQSQVWVGGGGGAAWGMSRHTKNPKLASELIIFVTTDPSVTSVAVTLSAYEPGGDEWAKALLARSPLIASEPDPYETLTFMAGKIWPDIIQGPPTMDAIIGPFVTDIMAGKNTWVGSAEAIQAALVEQVVKAGYEVETTGP